MVRDQSLSFYTHFCAPLLFISIYDISEKGSCQEKEGVMKRLKRKLARIFRKPRRAVSVLDRARKGNKLEFVRPGMRLAISY